MNSGVPDVISAQPISHVYVWLGGPQPKNGRGPAFFRDGDNWSAIDLNDEKGCWFDHRDGIGGGVLDLVQHVRGCDRTQAVKWLSERNGVELDRQPVPVVKPVKKAAAVRESLERDGWRLVVEGYFSDDLRQVRYEHATRIQSAKNRPEKTFVWEHRLGDVWFSGAGGRSIPLYLNSIASERDQVDEIVVVEGWAKADALAGIEIPACSSKEINPSNAGQLAGFQRIVIWPDRDTTGIKTATRVAELLRKNNANVYMVDPPAELPEGGDVIDAIALGWDTKRIKALITSASAGAFSIASIKSVSDYANIEITYVYPGMLAEGTVNVLSGDAGAGKSSYASYLADRVARERQVLFCDRENPLPVVVDRFRRLGIEDGGNLKVWGGWCPIEAPGPDSKELLDWVAKQNPKPLLIWDSLISFHTSGDENNASEIRPYMQGFRRLADLGACVLVLHHSGKGESTKDYRGSSDIKASIDSGWHLANFGEGRLERMRLRAWKCRFAVATDVNLTYRDGEFTTDESVAPGTVTDQLIDLLREKPGIASSEFQTVARDRGLGRDRARQFIEEGVKAGTIERGRGEHNTMTHKWVGIRRPE